MISYLEFEKPLAELEAQIKALRDTSDKDDVVDISSEVSKLEAKAANQRAQIYRQLSPWQKTQVARHPQRPHFKDYVAHLTDDFMALGGDRNFGDDHAILGGFATLKTGQKVMLIGHEKGHDV